MLDSKFVRFHSPYYSPKARLQRWCDYRLFEITMFLVALRECGGYTHKRIIAEMLDYTTLTVDNRIRVLEPHGYVRRPQRNGTVQLTERGKIFLAILEGRQARATAKRRVQHDVLRQATGRSMVGISV